MPHQNLSKFFIPLVSAAERLSSVVTTEFFESANATRTDEHNKGSRGGDSFVVETNVTNEVEEMLLLHQVQSGEMSPSPSAVELCRSPKTGIVNRNSTK